MHIFVYRKYQNPQPKPHIEIPLKPERKVVSKILPVPRCNVDELLALESPKSPAIQKTTSPEELIELSLDTSQPLPPIPVSPTDNKADNVTESADGAFFMTQVYHVFVVLFTCSK